jgi:hypothetical protein
MSKTKEELIALTNNIQIVRLTLAENRKITKDLQQTIYEMEDKARVLLRDFLKEEGLVGSNLDPEDL